MQKMPTYKRVALYFDAQNYYLDHHLPDIPSNIIAFKKQLACIEEIVTSLGTIVLRRAYWPNGGKFSPVEERQVIKALRKAGFRVYRGPLRKDIDTQMVADCVDDLHQGLFTQAVIVAGDTDYAPIAQKLHKYRKPYWVIAIRGTIRAGGELQKYAKATYLVPKMEPCPRCGGTGRETEMCFKCDGTGVYYMNDGTCWSCYGTGKFVRDPCPECNGSGSI